MATSAEGDPSAQLAAALRQLVFTQQENRFLREQLVLQKEKSLRHQELLLLGRAGGPREGNEGALQPKLDSLISQSREMQATIAATSSELKQRSAAIEALTLEMDSVMAKARELDSAKSRIQQLEAELAASKPGTSSASEGSAAGDVRNLPHAAAQVSEQLHILRMRLQGAEERARLAEGALASARSAAAAAPASPAPAQSAARVAPSAAMKEVEEKARRLETEVVVLTEALKAATAELKENRDAAEKGQPSAQAAGP